MSGLYNGRSNLSHRDPTRTALFASNKSRSNSPLPMYNRPSDRYAADRTAEDIEGQNDEALEGLSNKVKLLKNITINIGNEVRDSTKLLNGMNDTFGETGDFLSGTMKKMKKMARRQGGQWCLWIAFLFVVSCVFFWTWMTLLPFDFVGSFATRLGFLFSYGSSTVLHIWRSPGKSSAAAHVRHRLLAEAFAQRFLLSRLSSSQDARHTNQACSGTAAKGQAGYGMLQEYTYEDSDAETDELEHGSKVQREKGKKQAQHKEQDHNKESEGVAIKRVTVIDNFKSQLSPANVAHELYSDVSCSYDAVRDVALDFAVANWKEVREAEGTHESERRAYAGELPTAAAAVSMLLARTLTPA
ncbi:hypothetical protein JCM21900_001297 [Sporobolomyces salmonicolor]